METNARTEAVLSKIDQQRERGRIEVRAENYSLEAANEPDLSRRLQLMNGFLDDINHDVEAGYIRQSNGGEPYTVDAIGDQLAAFAEQMNMAPEKREKDPQRYIPSAEGFRASFMALMANEATATPLLTAIAERQRIAEMKGEQPESNVAEKMGANALAAAGIEGEIDPFEQLPVSVQDEVLMYRRLVSNHRESEEEKNFSQAARDQEAINTAKKSLSPQAKTFLKLI